MRMVVVRALMFCRRLYDEEGAQDAARQEGEVVERTPPVNAGSNPAAASPSDPGGAVDDNVPSGVASAAEHLDALHDARFDVFGNSCRHSRREGLALIEARDRAVRLETLRWAAGVCLDEYGVRWQDILADIRAEIARLEGEGGE